MADIELVIRMPEEKYKEIVESNKPVFIYRSDVAKVLTNGIPLPKGHGRLIDADDIDNYIIGHVDTRSCPTIIEADKETDDYYRGAQEEY